MTKSMTNKLLLLKQQVIKKDFAKMNDKQIEAVLHTEGPLLILAGAGSGKTTVLVNRIANVIKYGNAYHSNEIINDISEDDIELMNKYIDGDQNYNISNDLINKLSHKPARPWEILAITFTNKAANELKERLSIMLGEEAKDIWASTFHSTCLRILRKYCDRLGYSNSFTIYDTDDSKRLIKDCQKILEIDDDILNVRSILSAISRAKDQMIQEREYKELAGDDYRLNQISNVYSLYQKRLRESDAMDFDDLILNTVLLFKQNKDILEYYQNKFRYIFVDEYQDTNVVQYEFINLLSQKHRNLCVVGDDDQSIYKFRGATIENILSFEKHYKDAKVIKLEQNYRSTQNILDAANAIIKNNNERKHKELWTNNPEGKKIFVHTSLDEQDEALYIANKILDEVSKEANYTDFSILYRMNSQSNILEKVFMKAGVPYRIIGGLRFYERKEIKDMIAYLNVINNPSDETRLKRIINYPKRAIGDKTILNAHEISQGIGESFFDVIKYPEKYAPLHRASAKLKVFTDLIENLIEKSQYLSLHDLYNAILEDTQYIEEIKKEKEESATRIENIKEFASNILKYEEDNGENASLEGFLSEISLMTDIDNYDKTSNAVVMMTMHSAKGLEFPTVFLPGFEEGIFPGMMSMERDKEIEEERRLAYVGITRARKELYILNTHKRMIFGRTSANQASRFVMEIPESLLEKTKTPEVQKTTIVVNRLEKRKEDQAQLYAKNFYHAAKKPENKMVFENGEQVAHKVFGNGKIISVVPMGNDNLIEIEFDRVGIKKLMSNFAPLEKV